MVVAGATVVPAVVVVVVAAVVVATVVVFSEVVVRSCLQTFAASVDRKQKTHSSFCRSERSIKASIGVI